MTTDKASEKLRVDLALVPMTAIFVAMLALGNQLHDAFLVAMGGLGLACVAGICACEFFIRKHQVEIDKLETGGRE